VLVGAPGSFIVSVDGEVVAEKKSMGFPTEDEIVAAVRSRLQKR
jgi:predicted regulator of Ras-like GTPase activity (Roadblock/LC7/MglB family)